MLRAAIGRPVVSEDNPSGRPPYAPAIEVLDEVCAVARAILEGLEGEAVMGRAWISNVDGVHTESATVTVKAGETAEFPMRIDETRTQNGNIIACARVEWPELSTKHFVRCTLVPS